MRRPLLLLLLLTELLCSYAVTSIELLSCSMSLALVSKASAAPEAAA
jgi:hypothetical protein